MRFTFPGEPLLADYEIYEDPEAAEIRKPRIPKIPKGRQAIQDFTPVPVDRLGWRGCNRGFWFPFGSVVFVVILAVFNWVPTRELLEYFEKADRVVLVDGQRYAAFQYFGFNLFTAPGTEVDGCFDIGDDLDQCYLGSGKVQEDVEKRMNIMFEAVERLYASDQWDRSPTTLKIFMLPEFYWRGKQGAYRIHRGVEKVLHPTAHWISHRFAHERFKHWLVVDGTVVMAQSADERYVRMSERPYENISYYNFAPVHVGGTNLTYLRSPGSYLSFWSVLHCCWGCFCPLDLDVTSRCFTTFL